MNDKAQVLTSLLGSQRYTWLITGVAGFIGSNLLESLLRHDQAVIGLDDFSTGTQNNLDQVRDSLPAEQWDRFRFVAGDICDIQVCRDASAGADFLLHHAALGSVPLSFEDPIRANAANISGFVNVLVAARDAGVKRVIYAASSATYGDDPTLPKQEDKIGRMLSPYALTKYVNELYADVFGRCYALECIGLRYFNIFGPRQDPNGAYAAVIPQWISAMIRGDNVYINGDGATTRDFCYIRNVIQANVLAALTSTEGAVGTVYNIGLGERISLNSLYAEIKRLLEPRFPQLAHHQPIYRTFRQGDVRHSVADIQRARALLDFRPLYDLRAGLAEALDWYVSSLTCNRSFR